MDGPAPQRNRVHLDVWVPHDQVKARVAALAADGRLVSDEPRARVVDHGRREGNEVDVANLLERD
jgi:4a-hydroxytetrahydrobiopterin dehydratase